MSAGNVFAEMVEVRQAKVSRDDILGKDPGRDLGFTPMTVKIWNKILEAV